MRSLACCSCILLGILLFGGMSPIQAQTPDPPKDLNSNAIGERQISGRTIVPNFLDDQKQIWLFPAKVAQGSHVFPTVAVLGATAGLVAADPIEARYFRRNEGTYHRFNNMLSGTTTTAGILAFPTAFYCVRLGRSDSYAQDA